MEKYVLMAVILWTPDCHNCAVVVNYYDTEVLCLAGMDRWLNGARELSDRFRLVTGRPLAYLSTCNPPRTFSRQTLQARNVGVMPVW